MRAVVQRVKSARVTVGGETVAQTGEGVAVFVGIKKGDTPGDVEALSRKVVSLRIFPDKAARMAEDIKKSGGEILVISQFTLYARCSQNGRLSFDEAEKFQKAHALYDMFVSSLEAKGLKISQGKFGAEMETLIDGYGPVTILLDSEKIV